ncbi:MAG: hypothetical protein IPG93_12455 [Burkholderiales bacterium]|nr:hypothetical protein [Burkholderiales bacterium]
MFTPTLTPQRLAASAVLAIALALSACGGGSDDSASNTPSVDPTVGALSGQLPSDTTDATALPASLLPPDATAAIDSSLLPPS